jgi:excinuclease ABC subunit C
MECFDIANIGTAHCVASMVRFKKGVPDNGNYRRYRIRAVSGQNDFISMAEVVRRRYSRILLEGRARLGAEEADFSQEDVIEAMRRLEQTDPPDPDPEEPATFDEAELPDGSTTQLRPAPQRKTETGKRASSKWVRLPDLIIVDGGKGQLGMAVAELQRLGLGGLPIIGLAKEREEIFLPGESDPIVIPHDRGALKLLQRIRDEAHRWANGYHQLLLSRRMDESLLDDCPGVSQARKAALLKTFGSTARLRAATSDQLATTPGISKTLAATIHDFLQSQKPT